MFFSENNQSMLILLSILILLIISLLTFMAQLSLAICGLSVCQSRDDIHGLIKIKFFRPWSLHLQLWPNAPNLHDGILHCLGWCCTFLIIIFSFQKLKSSVTKRIGKMESKEVRVIMISSCLR